MQRLAYGVLGPLEIRGNDGEVGPTAPLERKFLSLLLLRLGAPTAQDELIYLLWSGHAPTTARASLQNLVHALRRRLGRDAIERTPSGYELSVERAAVDLERFRDLVDQAKDASAIERAQLLRDALALWRGAAFEELRGESWAQGAIARIDEEQLTALEDRIDADLELGRHAALVSELQELVHREPVRERLWFQLMLALYRCGRQADALTAYRRAHDTFVAQLGIEPGVVLRELQRAILVQDRVLDDPSTALGSTLERAAGILPRAPRERAQSLLDFGSALVQMGDVRQATSTLEAAARISEDVGERGLAERARILLSYLDVFAEGRSVLAHLRVSERAARVFAEQGDHGGLALALRNQAHMLRDMGRAQEALELAQRGAEHAVVAGDRVAEASCRRLAASCAAIGPTPVVEALQICDAADAVAGDDRPRPASDARAWLLAQANEIDEARDLYERGLPELRSRGIGMNLTVALAYAALAERSAGEFERAAVHFRAAYELVRAQSLRGDVSPVAGELACVLAHGEDMDEARGLAEEARSGPVEGDVVAATMWRRALAVLAARDGGADNAVALLNEAQVLAAATDWLTFRAETLEDAAVVHRLCAHPGGEAEALEEALALYEQKGHVAGAARVRAALAA